MMSFILDRTDERLTKSVGRILLYALLFFLLTRIACVLLVMIANVVYMNVYGVNPQTALSFMGNPEVIAAAGWWALPQVLLLAPLLEECYFRLGLSFRRWHVALGLGSLVMFFASRIASMSNLSHPFMWGLPLGLVVAGLLWFLTTDGFWQSKREKWLRPMMWCSAILFGLVHLFAMSGLTWVLLPYALIICLMIALAGCVFVYLRVNLGFWWAVGLHIINNILPAITLTMLLMRG